MKVRITIFALLLFTPAGGAFAQSPSPPTEPPPAPIPASPPPPPEEPPPQRARPAPPREYPVREVDRTPPTPGHHEHDGLFLRALVGFGYTEFSTEIGTTPMKISGTGAAFSLALGGTVVPNLVVFGEITRSIAMEPEVDVGGQTTTVRGANAFLAGIGAGLGYYLPNSAYLSGTLAFSRISLVGQSDEQAANSELGPGFSFVMGKEWWVTDNWGLGAAGQLFVARTKDKKAMPSVVTESPTWTSLAFNLLLSASFN